MHRGLAADAAVTGSLATLAVALLLVSDPGPFIDGAGAAGTGS